MRKEKDKRYATVKKLFVAGFINYFGEVFEILPYYVLARDIGMNTDRLKKYVERVERFTVLELLGIADIFEIDHWTFITMIHNTYKYQRQQRIIKYRDCQD